MTALDGGGDAIDVERADDGGDRQEQPHSKEGGTDATEQVRQPAEPAVQVEQVVCGPDGGDVQGCEAGGGPEEAAEKHAQEDTVVELAEGAGEGGEQGGPFRSSVRFGGEQVPGAARRPNRRDATRLGMGFYRLRTPRANAWPGRLSNRTRPIGRRNSLSFNAGPAQTDHTGRYRAHLVIVCLDDRIECRRIDQTFSISKDSRASPVAPLARHLVVVVMVMVRLARAFHGRLGMLARPFKQCHRCGLCRKCCGRPSCWALASGYDLREKTASTVARLRDASGRAKRPA